MAGRDIQIPFGPDRTGSIPLDAVSSDDQQDSFANQLESTQANPRVGESSDPTARRNTPGTVIPPENSAVATTGTIATNSSGSGFAPSPAENPHAGEPIPYDSSATSPIGEASANQTTSGIKPNLLLDEDPESTNQDGQASGVEYRPGGISDEEATAQGMDDMQMSILALKDSIGQGRELKEREKERKELAEALEADHIELADREDILANYQTLVAEQDAIIMDRTQRRDVAKDELSQLTIALEQTQAQLEGLREQHGLQLQPLETDLGRARAAADQAKNDERSRKSELNAAESELRKAGDADANYMAVARHQQVQAAYDEARARSEQAKEQLAQVQKAYDDAKQRSEQAQGPLERNIEDYKRRIQALKESINTLGDELSAARNRRQYCDTVYQYPNETAQMRSEIEQAEALARQMDSENQKLRERLTQSKQKARKAKIAIAIIILIIVVIVVSFIILSGR